MTGAGGGRRRPTVAVVGHVEWISHVLGRMPAAGRISYLTAPLEEPGGGGGVAASQVVKLGARCLFLTALGDDHWGRQARLEMEAVGVEVRAALREEGQTRALSAVGPSGDRAIAVVGTTIHPAATDDLGWEDLARVDAVYFTGRDPATLALARRAPRLVVATRRRDVLREAAQPVDVIVGSDHDPDEAVDPAALPAPVGAAVWTRGAEGGVVRDAKGEAAWRATEPPGPPVDTYGCGDSFAAGLTVGLARGYALMDAVMLGARCGAANVTGRGGLRAQLREAPGG